MSRACTTSLDPRPGGHEQLHHTLQADSPRHLRFDPHHPTDLDDPGRTAHHDSHIQLPLPTMPHDRFRGRSIEAWN